MRADQRWTDETLLTLFDEVAVSIAAAIGTVDDLRGLGARPGQYQLDLAADRSALALLDRPGLGVLSEESGLRRADAGVVVVMDPVDGSTNASRGIPWFATSLCAVDGDGPRVALVRNLASGRTFTAVRGSGARCDGAPLVTPLAATSLDVSIVALSGMPPTPLGWQQFRVFGAAALDLCAVAEGVIDAFVDCSVDAHGAWDYLGGLLVCTEAGAVVADARGRDLVVLDHAARRTPVAAAGPALLAEALAARRRFP